ncbi:hypothetical protein Tco_1525149 [Tanacetum coccineum]
MIKDKGKAIMIEPEVPLKRKDQVAFDEDLERNLQAQLEVELIEEERLAMKKEVEANIALIESKFDNEMRRVNTFIPMDSEVVKSKKETEESSKGTEDERESDKSKKAESSEKKAKGSRKKMFSKKRAGKEQQQESSKRQRIEDDKETYKHEEVEKVDEAELKKHLVIVKDDDIAIDAIPLATKPPGINSEDLQTLWKLVKTKHGDTRPEDDHERVLWGDLKVMFKANIKSDVWRNLQGYKVTIWKLFDSCGVHFVRLLTKKLKDSEDEHQVQGRIGGT